MPDAARRVVAAQHGAPGEDVPCVLDVRLHQRAGGAPDWGSTFETVRASR